MNSQIKHQNRMTGKRGPESGAALLLVLAVLNLGVAGRLPRSLDKGPERT